MSLLDDRPHLDLADSVGLDKDRPVEFEADYPVGPTPWKSNFYLDSTSLDPDLDADELLAAWAAEFDDGHTIIRSLD